MANTAPISTRARKRLSIVAFGLAGVVLVTALVLALTGHAGCSSSASTGVADLKPAVVVRVVDGDTLVVRLPDGEEGSVRLIGVDAPESVNPDESMNSPEGEAASAFVKSLVKPGRTVWLARDVSDTDKYGRWLRYVWLEQPDDIFSVDEVRTKMLNGILVDTGHAQVKRYTPDVTYHEIFLEIEAGE